LVGPQGMSSDDGWPDNPLAEINGGQQPQFNWGVASQLAPIQPID